MIFLTTTSNATAISDLIRSISLTQRRQINQRLTATSHITDQQAMILSFIGTHPGLIQKQIVTLTQRRAATVSALLKKLEDAELITRTIPANNTRNKQLFLTDQGQQVVSDFTTIRHDVQAPLTAKLSAKQQEKLIKYLNLALQGMDD